MRHKRAYNSRQAAAGNALLLDGETWYLMDAFRALNQALGRCIRHATDFGALVLLDDRLASAAYDDLLPRWLQGHLHHHHRYADAHARLGAFFARHGFPPADADPAAAPVGADAAGFEPASVSFARPEAFVPVADGGPKARPRPRAQGRSGAGGTAESAEGGREEREGGTDGGGQRDGAGGRRRGRAAPGAAPPPAPALRAPAAPQAGLEPHAGPPPDVPLDSGRAHCPVLVSPLAPNSARAPSPDRSAGLCAPASALGSERESPQPEGMTVSSAETMSRGHCETAEECRGMRIGGDDGLPQHRPPRGSDGHGADRGVASGAERRAEGAPEEPEDAPEVAREWPAAVKALHEMGVPMTAELQRRLRDSKGDLEALVERFEF